MKKILLILLAILALATGSSTAISSASASTPPASGKVTFTVGTPVNLDLGCVETAPLIVWFDSGYLPTGLVMNPYTGLVTGTPTESGTFFVGGYNCGSSSGQIEDRAYSLTFIINPIPTTPAPFLEVHNVNKENCSLYFGYSFPVITDPGSVFISWENQDGTAMTSNSASNRVYYAGQIYGQTIAISELNALANQVGIQGSYSGNEPYKCGDTLTVTVGYQFQGAPVATQTVAGVIVDKPSVLPVAGGAPTQKLIPLNNDSCEFRVLATLPSAAKPGTARIGINSPGEVVNQVSFIISDQKASGLIDFTFDPGTLSNGPINMSGLGSEDYRVSSPWACGSTLYISVDYYDLQGNYWSSTLSPETNVFGVTPTRPTVGPGIGDFVISAIQSDVGACSINVTAHVPFGTTSGPLGMDIYELEGSNLISGVYNLEMPIPSDGILTSTLSFASKADMSASWPLTDDQKILDDVRDCTGTYRVVLDTIGGVLAETLVTLGQLMPSCNAGSVQVNHRCQAVDRGFYTTELNSIYPIACPFGMTTATTASKSLNDCYKPMDQTIAGFKAPKAMKFKGTTNLAVITNTKAISNFRVTGPCTAKLANIVTKVKGKKVTTKMLKVTAGKKAGMCSVALTSEPSGRYFPLDKVIKIKVSKTGK